MIEGNRLEPKQIEEILKHKGHFPKYERDENEVKGYYAALTQIEQWAARGISITEKTIRTLHAPVIAGGKSKVKPTPYRDGQNVTRNGRTRAIIYMPPKAKDVPKLMSSMVDSSVTRIAVRTLQFEPTRMMSCQCPDTGIQEFY